LKEDQKTLSICVLGGSGFIGRHLLNKLKRLADVQVKALSHYKKLANSFPDHIQLVKGDVRDLDSLIRFLVPHAIVINLTYLNTASADDNIRAMDNLAKACISVGVARLIHCSTAVVAGNAKDDVITEKTPCLPANIYEKTKLKIENLLLDSLKGKCEVAILRPTAVFGPHGKNGLKLIDDLVNGHPLIRLLKTSLYSRRRMNFVSVINVVDAIIFLAHFSGALNDQCYIVSDDDAEENNYFDVSALLSHHLGLSQVRMVDIPFQSSVLSALLHIIRRTNTNSNRIYSMQKLTELGFTKSVSLHDEIKRVAQWYQVHRLSNDFVHR
jgi:nucleoside-diphosphate-sugar epimerase